MSTQCPACSGTGFLNPTTLCPSCEGTQVKEQDDSPTLPNYKKTAKAHAKPAAKKAPKKAPKEEVKNEHTPASSFDAPPASSFTFKAPGHAGEGTQQPRSDGRGLY